MPDGTLSSVTVHTEHSEALDAVAYAMHKDLCVVSAAWPCEDEHEHRALAREALAALTEAGYQLLPPGLETARTYTDYRYGGWEGLDDYMARAMRREGKDVERRTVTEYATAWEPFNG